MDVVPAQQHHRGSEPADDGPGAHPGRATVLVVGTDDWAIEQSATELEAGGCTVLRCHEPGEPAFPCNALVDGRTCPLDVGFDAVVTVRARPLAEPHPAETGVICALHRGAPLVVAGVGSERPFGPWAALTVEQGGDVLTACDKVMGASAYAVDASPGSPDPGSGVRIPTTVAQ